MSNSDAAVNFYLDAYGYVSDHGFFREIEWAEHLPLLEQQDAETFFEEYVWCVLNAGMKEQIARKIYERFAVARDPLTIGHLGKRAAVQQALMEYPTWFKGLLAAEDRLAYLESLPWIGPITKYHLARNIGIDCVKPDRHLVRLAARFGYSSPDAMCRAIQAEMGGRLGAIDVVLWRYCNLTGEYGGQSKLVVEKE
jgi:hypothetical protein